MLAQAALAALLPKGGAGISSASVEDIARLNRCVAFERLDRNVIAMGCYEALVMKAPRYARAQANRGTVLYEQGRLAEAVAGYDTALRLIEAEQWWLAEAVVGADAWQFGDLGIPCNTACSDAGSELQYKCRLFSNENAEILENFL